MAELKCKNCGGSMEIESNQKFAICEYCGCRERINEYEKSNTNIINNTVNGRIIETNSTSIKSRTTAGLLAIFLGTLGIHNFYLGYTKKATIQLLLTLIFCWTYIIPIAIWIWTIIEAVLIFQGKTFDSNGNELLK